jgi:adenylate cyclase class IV
MFQLIYRLNNVDDFTHQITQLGAQFMSKGPESDTYYNSENGQLRLQQGVNSELILTVLHDHYQEVFDVDIPQFNQFKDVINRVLGERMYLSKQVVRYHFKNVLFEIHRFEKQGDFLIVEAETLHQLKEMARQLNLPDHNRLNETPADLVR